MRFTTQVFLAAVVVVACPPAHAQGSKPSAAASTPAPAAKGAKAGGSSAVSLEACKKLVNEKKFTAAKESCTSAVKRAETLPAKQWRERSDAYSLRGHANLGANDPDSAAQDFQQVISLDEKNLKTDVLALAVAHADLALAQFQLGDLENLNFADQNFQKASDAIEVDILNDPAKKTEYQSALKGILVNYAKVKRAIGQENLALALEQQAGSIHER
jgi:tetratricopeptide (TPR) repeat protein